MPEFKWSAFFCGGLQYLPLTFACFVSAEQGKVLKVLHTSEGVFIISQYSLFHNEGPVLNMAVDSQKVSLVSAFSVNLQASHRRSKLLKQAFTVVACNGWDQRLSLLYHTASVSSTHVISCNALL